MPQTVQPYEKSSRKISKKELMYNNFIGGIFWAFGVTIGLSLIFFILVFLSKYVSFVPVVGDFLSDVINYILATNPNLQK